jgi:hypothetical protein
VTANITFLFRIRKRYAVNLEDTTLVFYFTQEDIDLCKPKTKSCQNVSATMLPTGKVISRSVFYDCRKGSFL